MPLLMGTFPLTAQEVLEETLSKLERWVDVEKTISQERADWDVEQQSLLDLIAIRERELTELDAQIEEAAEVTSEADAKRAALLDERDRLRAIENDVESMIIAQEEKLKAIIERLPQPLQREIEPLSSRVPKDSRDTRLGLSDRLANIAGILTQLDKFNAAVDVVSGQREFGAGNLIEVKTIYFGLGAAFFADPNALHGGYGVPGEDGGWTWTEDNSLAADILMMIEMYEGNTNLVRYVPMPVKIQ